MAGAGTGTWQHERDSGVCTELQPGSYGFMDRVGVYYWIEDNCSYALSGNLGACGCRRSAASSTRQRAALEAAPPR